MFISILLGTQITESMTFELILQTFFVAQAIYISVDIFNGKTPPEK